MNTRASVLMMPLSTLFRAVTEVRLAAYQSGFFRASTLPAAVISVGNLTTGGTGKTPLVEWLCRTLADKSGVETPSAICVLTRGYGKLNPKQQVLVSNGIEVLADVREAGDEPFLLAKNLVGLAAVIANPDRVAAGEWAIRNLGTKVFVLDDGFQHLRIARDFDIVTIDATNPFGGGEMLPRGRLREPLTALSRADCVVLTRSDQARDLAAVKEAVRKSFPDRPIYLSRMETTRFREMGGQNIDREGLSQQPAGVFCAVGNPNSFLDQVRSSGLEITFSSVFPDHHNFSQADIDTVIRQARAVGATLLVTTAKDATKLLGLKKSMPCYVLEIRIAIDDEARLAVAVRSVVEKQGGAA